MDNDSIKDSDEPFIGTLLPRVTQEGQVIKTFHLNREERDALKLKEVSELCKRLRLPGNPADYLERKRMVQHDSQNNTLHERRSNFIRLMGLGQLHEGPKKKNRPSEFLDSIITLSGTDIDNYKVGKEIFMEGMPPWIREKLRILEERDKLNMINIARFADSLLATELMDLPDEILLQIVRYLRSNISLFSLSKVCTKLFNISWHGEMYTMVISEDGKAVEDKLDSVFQVQNQEQFWIYLVVCNCVSEGECAYQRKNISLLSERMTTRYQYQTVTNTKRILLKILLKINKTNEMFIRKLCSVNSNNKNQSCNINDLKFSYFSKESNPCDNILFRDCERIDDVNSRGTTRYCKFKRRREIERLKELIKGTREPMDVDEAERLDFVYHNELMDNHLLVRFEIQEDGDEEEDEEDYIPQLI